MKSADRRIAYLGRVLPALSETFVTRELQALRSAGVDVVPFSIFRPDPSGVHPEARQIYEEVVVLSRPANPLFWLAHLWHAVRHPLRYFGLLFGMVIAPRRTTGSLLRRLQQFIVAPYAALRLKRTGVSHVHAHFAHTPGGVAMMGARLAGIGYSITIHSYDLYVETTLLAQKLENAEFIATVSHRNVGYLREHFEEATRTPLHVVRCGVDPADFEARPKPGNARPMILGVGRLVELKGFHTLIEAVALLRDRGLEVDCYIAGDGPEEENLKAQAAQLGLSGSVNLLGRVMQNDLREYYRRTDVFVLPSCVREYQDNIPVVLIEALAQGIPSVTTNISAIPELVRDGETGLLVTPEQPNELADAMERLISESGFADRLAAEGRFLVEREFNVHVSAAKLRELFAAIDGKLDGNDTEAQ